MAREEIVEKKKTENLSDLSDRLMEQFDKLDDPNLCDFELQEEIGRSMVMCHLSKNIIQVAQLKFKAAVTFPMRQGPRAPSLIGEE